MEGVACTDGFPPATLRSWTLVGGLAMTGTSISDTQLLEQGEKRSENLLIHQLIGTLLPEVSEDSHVSMPFSRCLKHCLLWPKFSLV